MTQLDDPEQSRGSPTTEKEDAIEVRGHTIVPAADLIGADFSWADLSGVDLTMADLSAADLRGADLSSTNSWRRIGTIPDCDGSMRAVKEDHP
ncbi:MAG: pentapeptide repeat-containing protein [Ardenticatenaceae bacterium]|nr:pentapeptide repeat-containing protein [Ardenticatenaceae bacterium]